MWQSTTQPPFPCSYTQEQALAPRGAACWELQPHKIQATHLNQTIIPARNALQQSDLLTAQEHPPNGKGCQKLQL